MSKLKRVLSLLAIALMLGTLSGCATTANDGDPIEGLNRVFYDINDGIDNNFIKPVAVGYTKVTPAPIRKGVTNFFDNLTYLNVIFNDLLQGKIGQGIADSGRFIVNTTLGVAGLFDVATGMGLEVHDEDLGQTFGVWGASEGAYLNLPLRGSNTVRDAPDMFTSSYLNPLFYMNAVVTIPLAILDGINTRANLLEASNIRDEAALDPYVFTREAYRQQRTHLIYDGNPPTDEFDDFMEEGDDGTLTIE